jgi:tyrosinase
MPLLRSRSILLGLVVALAPLAACSDDLDGDEPSAVVAEPGVRQDAAELTAEQAAAFVAAVRLLQTTPAPGAESMSWYSMFVDWHRQAFSCELARGAVGAAHNSPLFLPWHREFLIRYETALQQVSGDPMIRLPYWDWTDESSTAAVFSDALMGGDGDPDEGYAVTSGPFAKGVYELTVLDPEVVQETIAPQTDYLVRRFGVMPDGATMSLPTADEVLGALGVDRYDGVPWDATADPSRSFRNHIEGWDEALPPDCTNGWQNISEHAGAAHNLHNGVHMWVGGLWEDEAGAMHGGTMLYNTSPNDPVFFLHHANIDRLWAEWQEQHGLTFPADAAGYSPASTMWPWFDRTIASLESTLDLGYRYDTADA